MRAIVLVSWGMAVAFLTLTGGEAAAQLQVDEIPHLCLLCGTRGTADALLNLVLFVPLGLALGGTRGAIVRAAVAGLAVSACIEAIQIFLPGRHAAVSDLLWNTLGAAAGVQVFRVVRRRLSDAWRMDVAWGGVLALGFIVAGALMMPSPTDDDYWGQWTPDLGSMPEYGGRVLEARINGMELPPGRIDHPGSDASLLEQPWVVEGTFVVGPPPPAVSPIVSIYDGHQREIVLLGADDDDLVFREHMLAHRLRFDVPDIRIPGALGPLAEGDTARIQGRRSDGSLCLRVGEARVGEVGIGEVRVGGAEECGLGATPGRSWGFLLYVEGPTESFRDLVDMGWLAILFFPLGFFGGSRRRMAAGTGIALVGMAVAVAVTPLVPGPWREVLACLGGVGLGWGCVRLLGLVAGTAQASAEPSTSAGPPMSKEASISRSV